MNNNALINRRYGDRYADGPAGNEICPSDGCDAHADHELPDGEYVCDICYDHHISELEYLKEQNDDRQF
jgi:hypothetical protein